jgi:hypothetical protein
MFVDKHEFLSRPKHSVRDRRGRDRMIVGFTVTYDRSVVYSGYSGFLNQ